MDRTEVDNFTVFLLQHLFTHCARHIVYAVQIRTKHFAPILCRLLRRRYTRPDARVIHQNIDALILFDNLCHRLIDAFRRHDVHHHIGRFRAEFFQRPHRLLQFLFPPRGDHHRRPLASQCLGQLNTKPG